MYHKLGNIPSKRHTVHENPKGGIYYEQLFGTEGFHGASSLLYHIHRPTMIAEVGESKVIAPVAAVSKNISPRMIQGFQAEPTDDFLDSRTPVLFNDDVTLEVAAPTGQAMTYYYKNGDSDELIFVHKGTGTMVSLFGELAFGPKDYIHIPRGTIYQMTFDSEDNRLFIIETVHQRNRSIA